MPGWVRGWQRPSSKTPAKKLYLGVGIWRGESKQAMGKDRLDIMGGRPNATSDWRPAQATWRMAYLFKKSWDKPGP